jgi:hypothetical protein
LEESQLTQKPADTDEDKKEKENTILELIKGRYDSELQRTEGLDSKGSNLIGYVTVITGLIVGLGTIDVLAKLLTTSYTAVAYFLGLAFLIASAICALLGTKTRKWHYSPTIEWCLQWLQDPNFSADKGYDRRSVLQRAAIEIGDAVKYNFEENQRKASWLNWAWILLVVGIGTFVIFLGLYTAQPPSPSPPPGT